MTGTCEISLKKFCFSLAATAFLITITFNSEARRTHAGEIYSTLTTDTIPPVKKGLLNRNAGAAHPNPGADTSRRNAETILDTIPPAADSTQRTDTFHFRYSKDTLDAPVEYEASDSGVLLVKEKKFILYGKTKTTYKDVSLTAPTVELNQETNILTAMNERDSAGNIVTRATFSQGTESFQSDTIRYNFKTQKGLTKNTYTKSNEMWVQGSLIKKVNATTTFAKHVIMTTCDYDQPHFGFVSNKGKFIQNKVAITGPVHPEFEGVPIPIYLPFGIFPLKQGRHSGLMAPTFTATDNMGIGLTGLGYYQVLNDYFDATISTDLYSYGSWRVSLEPTYRKRYKYAGSLRFNLLRNKENFKGDPDFRLTKAFNIYWAHSLDQRARPGTNFQASVNAGSTKYNRSLINSPYQNFQNQLTSSISYSKSWQGKPYNLSLNATHSQNDNNHSVNVSFPNATFTVTTLYPFQRKKVEGTERWYEKIGIAYNGTLRNQLGFYDTASNTLKSLLDTLQWGAQHNFPITMSLPPVGPLIFSPNVSYNETWLTQRMRREWNPVDEKIDTISNVKGLFIDRHMSFGFGMNTALYGTANFRNSRIIAIRHVIRPTIGFSYSPNLSKKYYDVIQVDTFGNKQALPQTIGGSNLFSGFGFGKFGGLTFGVTNNVEMKYRSRKDTGTAAIKKLRLIDNLSINSGYNFLQDSFKLQPFSISLSTTLFEKVNISAGGVWDPYYVDVNGRRRDRVFWQGDRFSLGRLSQGNVSISTNFQSKPRSGAKEKAPPPAQAADPNLQADKERLQDYIRRNPAEFVDFDLPWSFSISYSLTVTRTPRRDGTGRFKGDLISSLNFQNSFGLTPKWNLSTNGFFDFNTMKLQMFTMSISRDMHCWQMSVNVTPVGLYRSFNISISPKSSILQDLRVNRTRTFTNY